MKKYFLYRHIRLDTNEVFYVGIGCGRRHLSKDCRNKHWRGVVSKTHYEIEIIVRDLARKEACEKEKEFIKLYGRRDLRTGTLVNLTDGGEGNTGYIADLKTREKQSIAKKGYKPTSETIAKITAKTKGQKRTPEQIARYKISNSRKRKPQTAEHKANRGIYNLNRTSKPVICLNNGKTYLSARNAARELNISDKHIGTVCNGKRNHTAGFKFTYT